MWNRVGACRYRCVIALALPQPNRHSRRKFVTSKSIEQSAQEIQKILDNDLKCGFDIPIPESHLGKDGRYKIGYIEVYNNPTLFRAYRQARDAFERKLRARGEDERADALPPIRLVKPGSIQHKIALLSGGVIFVSEPHKVSHQR